MDAWLSRIFADPDLARMGHAQRVDDHNLGLGWIYYGLARCLRPTVVVVIGSLRGFVPLVLGKALSDNIEGGRLIFIDPSYVDDFWKDADAVRGYFARYDLQSVEHHLMTTQDFARSDAYRDLDQVGLLFIDGHHTEEQVRFDFETFAAKLSSTAFVLFHDTIRDRVSSIYGLERQYMRGVRSFVDKLRQDDRLQVFDLPFGEGVTLVRKLGADQPRIETAPASAEGAVT